MSDRIVRHALPDRLFHWSMAAAVLTLLLTAFLPILGVRFAWVAPHWIAGLMLVALVLFHIVRAALYQRLGTMWIGLRDLREGVAALRGDAPLPGKYSLAQKAFHLLISVLLLLLCATGLLMMVRVDTPFWRRDPYFLAEGTWGVIYVLHGLAALCVITMLMLHVYFALRPEKLFYTRSMIKGWITGAERQEHHDLTRWR